MSDTKDKKRSAQKESRQPPGPEADRVKIDMPWKEAMKKALKKKPRKA